MDAVNVIAVTGTCGPERRSYARRLATETGGALLPDTLLDRTPDPALEADRRAKDTPAGRSAVIELPEHLPVTEAIGALADPDAPTVLRDVWCVVDAAHLLDDLHREDLLPQADETAPPLAHAQQTVAQIEYASVVVLVNWTTLDSPALATTMALLSHLSPRARLRLHRAEAAPLPPGERYSPEQDRPGWMGVLNDDFSPHMTDRRVSALRHEQLRPLHPGRLRALLERIAADEFGRVVRSAGFCRLATRSSLVMHWDHTGRAISLTPAAHDDTVGEGEELLSLGQDLAVIGLDLDERRLRGALDAACLSDDELTAGPALWESLPDPFPRGGDPVHRGE